MMRSTTLFWIMLFGISAMVVNSIGIWIIHKNQSWAQRNKEYFMCFAAGMLISSALIIAFPEAYEKNSQAGLAALAGFAFMFFSNRFIQYKTKQDELAFGITAIQGIAMHSFLDGVIYSVTFSVSTQVGILAGVGLVIHEFAEGVITYSVLLKSGLNQQKALLVAFLVAALTTPIGAIIAYPLVQFLNSSLLGLALGFVVGVLIYISASHLLPEVREHESKHSFLALLSGSILALIVFFIQH